MEAGEHSLYRRSGHQLLPYVKALSRVGQRYIWQNSQLSQEHGRPDGNGHFQTVEWNRRTIIPSQPQSNLS